MMMAKKILVVFFVGFFCSFLTLSAPGCAKKPKAPDVEETVSKTTAEEGTRGGVKEEATEAQPSTTEKPYEGFKPVKEPAPRPADVLASIRLEDILFDFDKYDIRPDQKSKLEAAVNVLRDNTDLRIVLEGHCDERGTNAYNRALGEKRATSVEEFLISLGIKKSELNKISYGEEKPVCTEHAESCWRQNRRVHFLLSIGQ